MIVTIVQKNPAKNPAGIFIHKDLLTNMSDGKVFYAHYHLHRPLEDFRLQVPIKVYISMSKCGFYRLTTQNMGISRQANVSFFC